MAHKRIIDSVKKQGQVAIKDLDEFLRFVIYEYDMRTFDANYISILIPMKFDIDKVFGLNVCKRSDDDYVILYSCWYPNKDVFGRQFEMRLYHYDNSNDDDDLGLDIVMTQSQYDAVLQRFEEQYKKAYGVTVERDMTSVPYTLWQAQSCVSAPPMRISPIFVRFLLSALLSAKSA